MVDKCNLGTGIKVERGRDAIMEGNLLRVVIGAGEYDNNPEWIKSQKEELDLLDQLTWEKNLKENL